MGSIPIKTTNLLRMSTTVNGGNATPQPQQGTQLLCAAEMAPLLFAATDMKAFIKMNAAMASLFVKGRMGQAEALNALDQLLKGDKISKEMFDAVIDSFDFVAPAMPFTAFPAKSLTPKQMEFAVVFKRNPYNPLMLKKLLTYGELTEAISDLRGGKLVATQFPDEKLTEYQFHNSWTMVVPQNLFGAGIAGLVSTKGVKKISVGYLSYEDDLMIEIDVLSAAPSLVTTGDIPAVSIYGANGVAFTLVGRSGYDQTNPKYLASRAKYAALSPEQQSLSENKRAVYGYGLQNESCGPNLGILKEELIKATTPSWVLANEHNKLLTPEAVKNYREQNPGKNPADLLMEGPKAQKDAFKGASAMAAKLQNNKPQTFGDLMNE
jgi:hypothetical protein